MGRNQRIFEVCVEVGHNGSRHFSSRMGMYIEDKIIKMFHIHAKTHNGAMEKAKRYGRPLHVRKPNLEKMGNSAESIFQRLSITQPNPYPNAIAMDEMVWIRKNKRAERMENRAKNKNGH